MKYCKCFVHVLLLFIASYSFAQPKLVGTLAFDGPQNGGSVFRLNLPATTPGVIHSFNNLAPHRPTAGVCAGNDDWLYGILFFNGANNNGCLYRIRRDGSDFTVLYQLSSPGTGIPYYHTDGYIYFMDLYQLKKFDPSNNSVTDIPVNSAIVVKSLLIDSNDWIYFTGAISIAKVKTDGTGWTDLYTFNFPTDGYGSIAGLTEAPGDSLFGVQIAGGSSDQGTLYTIKKDGTGFSVLHHFTTATGSYPESKLVYFDGKLYGTTTQGGNEDMGVLYTINPDGTGYRIVHHFDPGTHFTGNVFGNISIASNGRIFGSFYQFYYLSGHPYRLFKVDTSGANFELFMSAVSYNQHDFGHFTQDVLLTDNDENIFLVTAEMGRHDGGAFSQADTSGNAISLYHFGHSPNGFRPMNGLIKASNGRLYGTALIGGIDGNGVVFSINADGLDYTKHHEFTDAEGYESSGKLLEASDGKLYGACRWSTTNSGCIYRMNKDGTDFEKIYSFVDPTQGYSPVGDLAEDNSGILYGAAYYSIAGSGTIFKMNKDGSNYTVVKSFNTVGDFMNPPTGVIISGDYLYGIGSYGGSQNKGGIFRVRKDGTSYEILHEFNGADGEYPTAIPIIASNGKLYGTTTSGGNDGQGVAFRIDIDGNNFTVLKHFSQTTDGGYPLGGVIQASDGLIYGSCAFSGIAPYGGLVYKMNQDGSNFTVLETFNSATEGQWVTSLLDLEGNFVLPVEWLTFTAQKRQQTVLLNWQTAQEQNSDRFEIERSANGINYTTIGTVAAAGNTSSVTDYSFTDYHPLNGSNFYRLKQIDMDGRFSYSKIAVVDFGRIARLSVFPNPASGVLNARWGNDKQYTALQVLDAAGRLILQRSIPATSTSMEVDIHQLNRGAYILQLIGNETEQKIFIKQ